MFLWAAVWMLREIEVRCMKLGHVGLRASEKAVSILLPSSKTDQKGKGIRRSLRCCHRQPCRLWCPWRMGCELLTWARSEGLTPGSPLFVTDKMMATKKASNIAAWKRMFGSDVSGHSPGRSGAMFYVRAGLPIQELAFLGRWKAMWS